MDDFRRLQQDVLAWNAERLVPLLAKLRAPRADVDEARQQLLDWNRQVSADSAVATTYVMWERQVRRMALLRGVIAAQAGLEQRISRSR